MTRGLNRKAISTVISTILMINIVFVMGAVLFAWTNGLLGSFTGGSQVQYMLLEEKKEETEKNNAKNSHRSMLKYFTTQGIMTDPGEYTYLYKDLPSDVEKLVEIVQGTMIHIFHANRYGVKLSEERKKEVQIRKVEEMLERIIELDSRPITQARAPEKRLVGNCRDHSVFLCLDGPES